MRLSGEIWLLIGTVCLVVAGTASLIHVATRPLPALASTTPGTPCVVVDPFGYRHFGVITESLPSGPEMPARAKVRTGDGRGGYCEFTFFLTELRSPRK